MLSPQWSSGIVKNSYYYDPYGNSLNKSETVSNPWQFASGYYDANTGLYKFGTRYYDPQLGRWTQKDPVGGSVGKIGSGNPYVYADNMPNMQTDSSGKYTGPQFWYAWGQCLGSVVIAPFLWISTAVTSVATVLPAAAELVGITLTAFATAVISWIAVLGVVALLAIGLACAVAAAVDF